MKEEDIRRIVSRQRAFFETGATLPVAYRLEALKRLDVYKRQGGRIPSDRTIADICREFGASEEWLRTGNGAMFADYKDYADLDLIMTEIQESDDGLIKSIVRAYWGLTDEKKAAIRDLVDGVIANLEKEKPGD